MAVLEKWGVEGEMNEFAIRNAASSYARIQVKNRMMKWIAICSITFLLIFMGMMIASVVIGIEVTKDFKVKNDVLVPRSGQSTSLKTSETFYSTKLQLTTSFDVVQGIKRLRFNLNDIKGQKGVIDFEVVSFYYSYGRSIRLYGHTHMANLLQDGSVELLPVTVVNGAKRYDFSKREVSKDVIATTTSQPNQPSSGSGLKKRVTSEPILLTLCSQLKNLIPTASYIMTGDIDCLGATEETTLNGPLAEFNGVINANKHFIKARLSVNNGVVGLFSRLKGATINDLYLEVDFAGDRLCGGVAVEIDAGTTLSYVGVYGSITCRQDGYVIVGGLASLLRDTENTNARIFFDYCVSQVIINMIAPDSSSAVQGGFYGVAYPQNINVRVRAPSPNVEYAYINPNITALVGFKSSVDPSSKKRVTITELGLTEEECAYYWDTDLEYISGLCYAEFWYMYHGDVYYYCCGVFNFDWCVYRCLYDSGPNINQICAECTISGPRDVTQSQNSSLSLLKRNGPPPRLYPTRCVDQTTQ